MLRAGLLDYSYTITQGSLPGGLTLDPTSGIISGTPTTSGTFSLTVQATNSGGSHPVSPALSISVAPGPPATSVVFPSSRCDHSGKYLSRRRPCRARAGSKREIRDLRRSELS